MKIKDKIVVHKVEFPDIDREKEDEFKILTIIKVRNDVPDMWGGNTKYTGYKAKDSNGKIYSQYWDSYPSDAMSPILSWYPEEKNDCIWYDVEQVGNLQSKPKWLKGEFSKIIHWCSKHTTLYYDKCFRCYMEEKYPETKQEYKKQRNIAKGW